jgi:L-fuculose-phosphate aldolase
MTYDPCPVIVEVCHMLAAQKLTSATGGNVSARMPDGTFWITATGIHKGRMQVADLVRITGEGLVVEGERRPSSEALMHLAMYRALPQAKAVVHAHLPITTGFALAHTPINTCYATEASAIIGPRVPVVPYGRPSTTDLSDEVERACDPLYKAYLLANHGVVSWGKDLWHAYDVMETLEVYAQSLLTANAVGGGKLLPEQERRWLVETYS